MEIENAIFQDLESFEKRSFQNSCGRVLDSDLRKF